MVVLPSTLLASRSELICQSGGGTKLIAMASQTTLIGIRNPHADHGYTLNPSRRGAFLTKCLVLLDRGCSLCFDSSQMQAIGIRRPQGLNNSIRTFSTLLRAAAATRHPTNSDLPVAPNPESATSHGQGSYWTSQTCHTYPP